IRRRPGRGRRELRVGFGHPKHRATVRSLEGARQPARARGDVQARSVSGPAGGGPMLRLSGLQRTLTSLYRIETECDVDDFVRTMDAADPEARRGEVVLVAQAPDGEMELAVLLDPRVFAALAGAAENDGGLPRFTAWCMAVEGVSHFTLLAFRAARERPVSQLELELQADVDKFVVGVFQRCVHHAPAEAARRARTLRHALFDTSVFHDPPGTPRGVRYRTAHHLAARYAAALERRYVRHARLHGLLDEVREFYRASLATKCEMALAG